MYSVRALAREALRPAVETSFASCVGKELGFADATRTDNLFVKPHSVGGVDLDFLGGRNAGRPLLVLLAAAGTTSGALSEQSSAEPNDEERAYSWPHRLCLRVGNSQPCPPFAPRVVTARACRRQQLHGRLDLSKAASHRAVLFGPRTRNDFTNKNLHVDPSWQPLNSSIRERNRPSVADLASFCCTLGPSEPVVSA